ncbi:exosortase-associated protein EpsI, B-type [Ideonella livida]|uniref:EpsI family protein n=1 Tax=Ideonella livida TaxID=2707176 RepID=A0A7C9PFX6_9BURK|nr:exosortase-associated protein EpsI, B-type [Ideonella livida]NDY90916.1 EpsI family protein [Ideonella livida]
MSAHDLNRRRAITASVAMVGAAAVGQAMVPTQYLAAERGGFRLDRKVPERFGEWGPEPYARGGIVNPQTKALLDQLYGDLLERTYVNGQGQRVMLTIAYGPDQSQPGVQLHYPEVCYPAQGFKVLSNVVGQLPVAGSALPVRRLETNLTERRPEPVTYWLMIGDQATLGGWDKRLKELRYGLRGKIVDGMLVRVSSIDPDSARAFVLHQRFVNDLVTHLDAETRRRLTGL